MKNQFERITQAITDYGKLSIEQYETTINFGNAIHAALQEMLHPAEVFGVPPLGEYKQQTEYRGAKFSYYGTALVTAGPASMGLNIEFPISNQKVSIRVSITITIRRSEIVVNIGDEKTDHVLNDCGMDSARKIAAAICNYIFEIFQTQPRLFEAVSSRKIGFT